MDDNFTVTSAVVISERSWGTSGSPAGLCHGLGDDPSTTLCRYKVPSHWVVHPDVLFNDDKWRLDPAALVCTHCLTRLDRSRMRKALSFEG